MKTILACAIALLAPFTVVQEEPPGPLVQFYGKRVVRDPVTLIDETVPIQTPYGLLQVDAAEIVRIDRTPGLTSSGRRQLESAIDALASPDNIGVDRAETAIREMAQRYGPDVLGSLKQVARSTGASADAARKLYEELGGGDNQSADSDRIITTRFTVRGKIEVETYHVIFDDGEEGQIDGAQVESMTTQSIDTRHLTLPFTREDANQWAWLISDEATRGWERRTFDDLGWSQVHLDGYKTIRGTGSFKEQFVRRVFYVDTKPSNASLGLSEAHECTWQLFVNGKPAGHGSGDTQQAIQQFLEPGLNVIALQVKFKDQIHLELHMS